MAGSLATLLTGLIFYAVAVEPYAVARHDLTVRIAGLPAAFEGYRILHLSDFEATMPREREERVRRIAQLARPDLVVVTGDLARKSLPVGKKWRAIKAMASWLGKFEAPDGIWFVQGHGEMASKLDEDELRRTLSAAGVGSLWDDVRMIERNGALLALAGVRVHDYGGAGVWSRDSSGLIEMSPGNRPSWLELVGSDSHDWTDYEFEGRLSFSSDEDWAGVMVHSRLSQREDRLYLVLRRSTRPVLGLSAHGTAYTRGVIANERPMPPGVWHRFRVKVQQMADSVHLRARTWPDGEKEPDAWDLYYADASETRIPSGTVGLYAEGPGVKRFADLRLTHTGGEFRASADNAAWIEPAGSDLLLDLLARAPLGTPFVLLSHTPDIFPDAAELGIDLVLAGHTQGGQVRVPLFGALVTDTRLGRRFAAGLFTERDSSLFVNRGVGTSRIPVRFLSPPEAAVLTLTRGDAP